MNKKTVLLLFALVFLFLALPKKAFAAYCGMFGCEVGEDCSNCPADCGVCPTGVPPPSQCTRALCGILAGCNCYENPNVCDPCSGYQRCSCADCPPGSVESSYCTYCTPNCTAEPRTCYDTPSCDPPINCNDVGGDAFCQTLVVPGSCGGTPACTGVGKCAAGGNCYTDCTGCSSPKYWDCEGCSCVLKDGMGGNSCTSSADCCGPTHRVCVGCSCVEVAGEGESKCLRDIECPCPSAGAVCGYIKNSLGGVIANYTVTVYNNNPPQTVLVQTDANGKFTTVANFAQNGDYYAVRPLSAPPVAYVPPAKSTTLGWTWNYCLNPNPGTQPWADTPLNSGSYECQNFGSGIDCSGPGGSGTPCRCSFKFDFAPTSTPTPSPTPTPTCAPPFSQCVSDTVDEGDVTLFWSEPSNWGDLCDPLRPTNRRYRVYNSPSTVYPPSTLIGDFLYDTSPVSSFNTRSMILTDQVEGEYYWGVRASNSLFFPTMSNVCAYSVAYTKDPWWQTKDGDVHVNGNITSIIPVCADDDYLSLDGDGGSPGVVSWGGTVEPSLGTGSISVPEWQANTAYYGANMKFDYLLNRLNVDTTNVWLGSEERDIPTDNGTYYADIASLTLNGRAISSGQKVVIFATGDVTVQRSPRDITVEPGGFFALIVKGNLTFSGANSTAVREAHGFFLADGTIIIPGPTNQNFEGQGSFVGWGGVSLTRDLGPGNQNCDPAESFISRPDLYLNAPSEFQFAPFVFQEVAP